jgi:hypothetical protein
VSISTAEDRIRICNAPHYSCAPPGGPDVVDESGLFGGGAAPFGFHLQRYELGQAIHAAVSDQV